MKRQHHDISIARIRNGVPNEKIQVKDELIPPETPEHLFKLHTISAFVAPRGSGKTNACVALSKAYLDEGSINEIYIISPTYESNPCFKILGVSEDHIFTSSKHGQEAILRIEQEILKKGSDWKAFEAYRKCYQRWKQHKHTLKDSMILENNQYRPPPSMKKPSILVIVDDMSCTDLYSTSNDNPLNNIVLRHRHIGGLGLSMFFLVQNFRHGMAKFMRQNMQQFFLWPVNDKKLVEGIYEEFANICSFEQFLRVFALATEDSHSFLTIDPFNPDPDERFRKNFDQFIIIPHISASKRLLQEYHQDSDSE